MKANTPKLSQLTGHALQFKFKLEDHPDLFSQDLINKIAQSKIAHRGKVIDMLVKDHKVSRAWSRNNLADPYYITHPCNCAIITWSENYRKHNKCSITYEELIEKVNEYDKAHGIQYVSPYRKPALKSDAAWINKRFSFCN